MRNLVNFQHIVHNVSFEDLNGAMIRVMIRVRNNNEKSLMEIYLEAGNYTPQMYLHLSDFVFVISNTALYNEVHLFDEDILDLIKGSKLETTLKCISLRK